MVVHSVNIYLGDEGMHYLSDYHLHSLNSEDGHSTVEEICRSAVDSGLQEIAITDHFEPDSDDRVYSFYRPKAYMDDILKARERFKGRLNIKTGVELGQPHIYPEESERVLKSLPYDYVIGSVHKADGGTDVYYLDYGSMPKMELIEMYLDAVKKLAVWGRFDCIGHIDLVKRYRAYHLKDRLTFMDKREMLEEVFRMIIPAGKGIEINTSGLRQAAKETMPGLDVLRLYRDMGGEILTIGSDAHQACDVGKGVEEAVQLAEEAGFKYLTVFNNRVPEWVSISGRAGHTA
jgi:histidinol-phosphatase (PHP family)